MSFNIKKINDFLKNTIYIKIIKEIERYTIRNSLWCRFFKAIVI